MDKPQISVIMPVYNREQYLKESIESILNQTFTDFEFIIVDDHSTDSSWQIIQEYAKKDSRIVAVKNTGKKGCYSARNCGHRLAKGKYIAVMDSDDISVPERLQIQFEFLESNPNISFCGGWLKNFGTDNRLIKQPATHEEIRDLLFFYCCFANGTAMFKRDSSIEYATDFNYAEDYDLWCQQINKANFANIQKILLLCRIHKKQISSATRSDQDNVANQIRYKNLKTLDIDLDKQEQKIYFDIIADDFTPQNMNDILKAINIFNRVSEAGKKFGYGEKFQELIKLYQKRAIDFGISNKATSLKLYFTTFRKCKIFETPRANLRYIYHCLRNLFHV